MRWLSELIKAARWLPVGLFRGGGKVLAFPPSWSLGFQLSKHELITPGKSSAAWKGIIHDINHGGQVREMLASRQRTVRVHWKGIINFTHVYIFYIDQVQQYILSAHFVYTSALILCFVWGIWAVRMWLLFSIKTLTWDEASSLQLLSPTKISPNDNL